MVETAAAVKPVPVTTLELTLALTPVVVVWRLMAAARAMPLVAFVDDEAVELDAVSSEARVAPMEYPLRVKSPADKAVGAVVSAPRFLVENCATLPVKVPKAKSALPKVPPTLLVMAMLLWSKALRV